MNVVSFATRKNEEPVKTPQDEAHEFILKFYDWAREHGIDTTTTRFKFDAAVVLTTVQSLLHERD